MRKALIWLSIGVAAIAVAALFSFFVQESVKTAFEIQNKDVTRIIQALSFFTMLLFELAVGFMLGWFTERTTAIEELKRGFLEEIKQDVRSVIKSGVGEAIFPINDTTGKPRLGPYLYELMVKYMQKNKTQSPEVFLVKAVLAAEVFGGLSDNLDALSTAGVKVNIHAHMRVSRALLQSAPVYMQVQTNCALYPQDWTNEWRKFIEDVARMPLQKKYIFVGAKDDFEKHNDAMKKAAAFLRERGFYVATCDKKFVSDSLGESAQLETAVVEFFGGDVIKTLAPYEGNYSGGKDANMIITTQQTDPIRHKYLVLVDEHEIGLA